MMKKRYAVIIELRQFSGAANPRKYFLGKFWFGREIMTRQNNTFFSTQSSKVAYWHTPSLADRAPGAATNAPDVCQ